MPENYSLLKKLALFPEYEVKHKKNIYFWRTFHIWHPGLQNFIKGHLIKILVVKIIIST